MRNLSPLLIKKSKLFLTPELFSKAKEEISEFDVIHLHEYRTFQNVVVSHYAKKYGIPYLIQTHGSLPREKAKKVLKRIYDASFDHDILRSASKVIALNQREIEQCRAMGLPEDKIELLPNGIDPFEVGVLPLKGCFREKYDIGKEEKIVLYLGRIHRMKGLEFLAEAFRLVLKEIEKARLVMIGPDDGYLSTFSKIISGLKIEEKVLLTGFLGKRDKLAALIDSEVFVAPWYYGFPLTFLEACIVGCPIVTSFNDLDWIDQNVGYVVENSPTAISKAIYKILQDDIVRGRFRENCRHIIEVFDISKITHQLEDVYTSAVDKNITQLRG